MGQSPREKERGGEESKERGGAGRGNASEKERARERNQEEGEKVSVDNERETQTEERGESSDSGALTQRCVTLKGMCWLWEVVLLSQMTSASL